VVVDNVGFHFVAHFVNDVAEPLLDSIRTDAR